MPDPNQKHILNVPGTFYVDDTCIDCDLCRSAAPSIFNRDDAGSGTSYVHRQPTSPEEIQLAVEAAEFCPSESIGADGA